MYYYILLYNVCNTHVCMYILNIYQLCHLKGGICIKLRKVKYIKFDKLTQDTHFVICNVLYDFIIHRTGNLCATLIFFSPNQILTYSFKANNLIWVKDSILILAKTKLKKRKKKKKYKNCLSQFLHVKRYVRNT